MKWRQPVAGVLLVLMTLAAYLPALRAGFVWDDDQNVTQKAGLSTLGDLTKIWTDPYANQQYYPLTHTSFWLEQRLWGFRPLGYHLVNILLHAAVAVLFWLVLEGLGLPGAWLAAAVFALHPLEVESVAWVTERKNVLSGVFFLASILAYLRFAGVMERAPARAAGNRRTWGLAFLCFALALLAKTAVSPLPAALLVILWWKQDRLRRGEVLPLAPFFALGAAAGLLTSWLERHHVGAQGAVFNLDFSERVLVAGKALWFYAGKLLWPTPVTFIYPRWRLDAGDWLSYSFCAGVLAVLAALWLTRRKTGKGPLAAVLWYMIMVFPALGFFNFYFARYSFVQDHFQYSAGLGLIALFVALALAGWRRWSSTRRGAVRTVGALASGLAAALVLLALGTMTWRQAGAYQDAETLWRDTLAKNPEAWLALNNLGLLLIQRGELVEGQALCERAIRVEPASAESYNNLGLALVRSGKFDEAQVRFLQAAGLDPRNDEARLNLGNILSERGRIREAIAQYEEALKIDANCRTAENNLGVQYSKLGLLDKAVEHYRNALRINPGYAQAHLNLAEALATLGLLDAAAAEYQESYRLNPGLEEALEGLQEILQLQRNGEPGG